MFCPSFTSDPGDPRLSLEHFAAGTEPFQWPAFADPDHWWWLCGTRFLGDYYDYSCNISISPLIIPKNDEKVVTILVILVYLIRAYLLIAPPRVINHDLLENPHLAGQVGQPQSPKADGLIDVVMGTSKVILRLREAAFQRFLWSFSLARSGPIFLKGTCCEQESVWPPLLLRLVGFPTPK